MKILFTNCVLAGRSGTEMFLFDLLDELREEGHQVAVYAGEIGALTSEMREAGLRVIHSLQEIPWVPDIIQCHHTKQCLEVLSYFPAVPGLYVCHDPLAWFDRPPPAPWCARYVCVSEYTQPRVERDAGIAAREVEIIANSVNLRRFKDVRTPRLPITRALVFHSGLSNRDYIESVSAICAELGVSLDSAGNGGTLVLSRPEEELPKYDLVFATGRCALEAMASGCAVILAGAQGIGPLILPENFHTLLRRNFGFSLLSRERGKDYLLEQLKKYAPESVDHVTQIVRTECSLKTMTQRYLALYRDVLEKHLGQRRAAVDIVSCALDQARSQELRKQEELNNALLSSESFEKGRRRVLARISSMENSWSWRITAPLRFVRHVSRLFYGCALREEK